MVPIAVSPSLLPSCNLYKGLWSMHDCSVWCRVVTIDVTPQEMTLTASPFIDLGLGLSPDSGQ